MGIKKHIHLMMWEIILVDFFLKGPGSSASYKMHDKSKNKHLFVFCSVFFNSDLFFKKVSDFPFDTVINFIFHIILVQKMTNPLNIFLATLWSSIFSIFKYFYITNVNLIQLIFKVNFFSWAHTIKQMTINQFGNSF